jgi:hypothetical protein
MALGDDQPDDVCPVCGTRFWELNRLPPERLPILTPIFRVHLRDHGWSAPRIYTWAAEALARHAAEGEAE